MQSGHSPCTILLIDDERAGLELRSLVLSNQGHDVLTATSPEEALALFRRYDVDLIVTDHLLGRNTAASLANSLKLAKPHIPIISLSGTTNVDEALRYADYFVAKAEGPDALIAQINELISARSREARSAARDLSAYNSDLQHLLVSIVENSSDAILSKTLSGIITSWNPAAEAMYGYTRDEMIGQSVTKLLPPDRPDEVTHILSRLKRGEKISHFETVRVSKDGRLLNVSLTLSPVRDSEGHIVGASTIARDISEQKKAEEALKKAEKLALAGRMAATVAHEINNPLEAIANILYLLQNTVELSPEARNYVNLAREEVKRVSEIARLVLGLQRGSGDRKEAVQLTSLMENVLTLYQRKAATIGVTVERTYETEEPVRGAPVELRQVFSNLVVNAMDALSASGSRLRISVRKGRRWDTGAEGVRVSVMDDGAGIPETHRTKLFREFHTTKGDHGTGIGLWVSRDIVHRHGGTIRFRSSTAGEHRGTTFSVFLPSS